MILLCTKQAIMYEAWNLKGLSNERHLSPIHRVDNKYITTGVLPLDPLHNHREENFEWRCVPRYALLLHLMSMYPKKTCTLEDPKLDNILIVKILNFISMPKKIRQDKF